MGIYGDTISIGGNTVYVFNAKAKKLPGTFKQVLGKRLIEHQIPHRNVRDWNLTYECIIYQDTRDDIRRNLENIYASVSTTSLVDGEHDGTYVIRDLDFNDTEQSPMAYEFTIDLVQWNQ
ncbi:hypothetical protein DRN69_00560 [Candidatus Pacearchaeota archaeon]|nr:MAG: hypothetical protein DRN69_00560 [Candidatus Pacearchaeota archaeon]